MWAPDCFPQGEEMIADRSQAHRDPTQYLAHERVGDSPQNWRLGMPQQNPERSTPKP